VDAIKVQLLLQSTVPLTLNRGTATNKLAIMSVSAYDMDRNWALHEVQLAFNDVDPMCFSHFES
jgi:hypothetical protein